MFEHVFCAMNARMLFLCCTASGSEYLLSSVHLLTSKRPMLHNEPELYSEFSNDENVETQTENDDLQTESSTLESTSSEMLSRKKKKSVSRDSISNKRSTSRDSLSKKKSISRETPPSNTSGSVAAKRKTSVRKTSSQTKEKEKRTRNAEEDDVLASKVLDYMRSANRPFVVGDIVLGFKNEISRVQIQRILSHLIEDKSIYCKVYGKSSVYCVVQSREEVDADAICSMDKEIEEVKADVRRLKSEAEKLTNLLTAVNEYPSDDVLRSQIKGFEEEIGLCRERLSNIAQDAVNVEDMKKVDGDIKRIETEIKVRRNFLRAIIDSLCEGTGMRKRELLCEIGLE